MLDAYSLLDCITFREIFSQFVPPPPPRASLCPSPPFCSSSTLCFSHALASVCPGGHFLIIQACCVNTTYRMAPFSLTVTISTASLNDLGVDCPINQDTLGALSAPDATSCCTALHSHTIASMLCLNSASLPQVGPHQTAAWTVFHTASLTPAGHLHCRCQAAHQLCRCSRRTLSGRSSGRCWPAAK